MCLFNPLYYFRRINILNNTIDKSFRHFEMKQGWYLLNRADPNPFLSRKPYMLTLTINDGIDRNVYASSLMFPTSPTFYNCKCISFLFNLQVLGPQFSTFLLIYINTYNFNFIGKSRINAIGACNALDPINIYGNQTSS